MMGGGNKDLFESQGKNLILHSSNRQTGKGKTKQACLSVCTHITLTITLANMKNHALACPANIKIRVAMFQVHEHAYNILCISTYTVHVYNT